jgi:hypothetical protein
MKKTPSQAAGFSDRVCAKDLIARADLKSPGGDLFSKQSRSKQSWRTKS